MTRRDWWLGIGMVFVGLILVAAAIASRGLVPRYEFRSSRDGLVVRIDRWEGTAVPGAYYQDRWHSLVEIRAMQAAKRQAALEHDLRTPAPSSTRVPEDELSPSAPKLQIVNEDELTPAPAKPATR